jgi:hypothetical protein
MLITRIRVKTIRSFSRGLMGNSTPVTQQKLEEILENLVVTTYRLREMLTDDKDTTNLC